MEEMLNLFGEVVCEQAPVIERQSKYTNKIMTPIYEPQLLRAPHILELVNDEKTKRLIRKIKSANIEEDERVFLIEAAHRHTVFNYTKIAEYYCHASKEMQELMEESALVVIDFDSALENGFTKLQRGIYEEWVKNKKRQEQNG